jgi:hypothetical protein
MVTVISVPAATFSSLLRGRRRFDAARSTIERSRSKRVGASGKSTTQTQRHPHPPLVSNLAMSARAQQGCGSQARSLNNAGGPCVADINLGGLTPRLKGGAATSPHLDRKDHESHTDRYVAMRTAHTPVASGGFKRALTTQLPQIVARSRRTCVRFESRLPASTRSGNGGGLRPHVSIRVRTVRSRCSCTSDLFDGFAVLQTINTAQRGEIQFGKTFSPRSNDRRRRHRASGSLRRFVTGRPQAAPKDSLGVAGGEDPGDREDEDASLVLTWSPRRLSERGRLSTGGRMERVSTPNVIRLCCPLLPRRCHPQSINSDFCRKA